MKFEQIKNPTKKLVKGFAGIFVIKLIILAVILVVQSCQKENSPQSKNQLIAKENFINSINSNMKSFKKLTLQKTPTAGIKTNSDSYSGSQDYASITLYDESGFVSNSNTYNSNIYFGDLFNIPNTDIGITNPDGTTSGNISPDQQPIISYDMPISQAEEVLQPTLQEAKNYLYSQGYSEYDIQELLAADEDGPAMQELDLIPAVMTLVAEQENLSGSTNFNMISMFGSEARAADIGDCAVDAFGIKEVIVILGGQSINSSLGKALMKKAVRKVATKALGVVGALIFAYDFADCMGWID